MHIFFSLLSNVELIIKKLGHKMDGYLDKILNILLCLGSSCNCLLIQKRDSLVGPVINLLKNIRSSVYGHTVDVSDISNMFLNFLFAIARMVNGNIKLK